MYPQTILTQRIRRTIMGVLIALFCIISPLLILYTAGYRYDFSQHRIKQTGVVSIDVYPRDVRVFINNTQIKKDVPIRLTNRAPGTYHVRIERDGYKTWRQDITVDSNQTTYIKDITLFADTLPVLIRELPEDASVSFSPNNFYALVTTQSDTIFTTSLYTGATQEWTPVNRSTDKPTISWSPSFPIAILQTKRDGKTRLERFDATKQAISKTATLSEQASKIQWNVHEPAAFIQEGAQIFALHDTLQPIGKVTSTVWFRDRTGDLWQYDDKKHSLVHKAQQTSLPKDVSIKKILDIQQGYVLAATLRGIEIIDTKAGTLRQSLPTRNILYDKAFNRWVTWSPFEIWTIHGDGSTNLENRFSNATINSVAVLNPYHSLVLNTDAGIDAYNPGYNAIHKLFRNDTITAMGVDSANNILYFFGKVGTKTGLYALPLTR